MDSRKYVYGMRIYLEDGHRAMADLAMGEGGRPNGEIVTIEYDNINERERYYINAYTFIWDERIPVKSMTFTEYVEGKNIE